MGLEVVVRPVVLPNIRPQPGRSLPPAEDPAKGFAVIRGNGFRQGTSSYSLSISASQSRPVEVKRRVDKVRVYQKKDNGEINKENFIDIKAVNKLWKTGGMGPGAPSTSLEENAVSPPASNIRDQWVEYYKRIEVTDNIELLEKDLIEENERLSE